MSLIDELYTKRQYLDDLGTCDRILRQARENIGNGVSGMQLMALEHNVAATRKLIKARWAENGRWFGALARAKRGWARKQFGEHDHESYKKLQFLKFVVASILDGAPEARPERIIAMPEGIGPWARERDIRNRVFMPDCDYEICIGGRWRPVQKADLPDKVRWI